jgi:hypothetical protein
MFFLIKRKSISSGICESYPFRDLMWNPKCDPDGSFAAVQCKGERLTGRCKIIHFYSAQNKYDLFKI